VFAENAVSMIGLGVGIDYALFIISRYRQELSRGHATREAVARAVTGAGEAVLFSGATVAVGFLALFMLRAPFLNAIALGGTFVVGAAVAAALTLLPALLSLLGGAVLWPRRPVLDAGVRPAGPGPWGRWAMLVMRHPRSFLAAGVALLVLLVLPVARLRTWSIGASNLSPDTESRRGYEIVATQFQKGWMGPIVLLLEAAPGHTVWEPRARQVALDITMRLSDDDRVAGVQGFPRLVTAARRLGAEVGTPGRLPGSLGALADEVVSPDGRLAQILVVSTLEPQSHEAKQQLAELRRAGFPEAKEAGLRVGFGGATASIADFDHQLMSSLPRVAGAVLALTFVVLLVLFRSLLIPLKATLLNLLSVLAAYGFLVLVFQDGHGASLLRLDPPGGLNSFIVLMLFTILFGLSMDYEVFLLTRVREEYLASGDTRAAIAAGLERTAGTITSAALIMISIFLAFGFTRTIATREFGLGLAFAVALDATLIRVVLVPASMALAGRWNWWLPGKPR
jgi:RND superfamily putative drug exporter